MGDPEMATAIEFVFWPSKTGTTEENLVKMFDHIKILLGQNRNFILKLDLDSAEMERRNVVEMTDFILKIKDEAKNLAKRELVPVAIDKDGETLYKAREKSEDSDS